MVSDKKFQKKKQTRFHTNFKEKKPDMCLLMEVYSTFYEIFVVAKALNLDLIKYWDPPSDLQGLGR